MAVPQRPSREPSREPLRTRPVGRRALLQAGGLLAAGTAVGVGLAGVGHSTPGTGATGASGLPGLAELGSPTASSRTPVPTNPTSSPPARPQRVHTWDQPIARLDAHVGRQVGTTFTRNAIMLTIDDGPDPYWTPRYLRLLARYRVPATFSLIGASARTYPALVRALVHDGHHLCNHTFHHPLDLPSLPDARIDREIVDTMDAIARAADYRPSQFRSPGGMWGSSVFTHAARHNLVPLGWDVDPRDWSLPGVEHIRATMLQARPHDIILCHDGGGNRDETYQALKTVLPALLARGFQFVTLPPSLV